MENSKEFLKDPDYHSFERMFEQMNQAHKKE